MGAGTRRGGAVLGALRLRRVPLLLRTKVLSPTTMQVLIRTRALYSLAMAGGYRRTPCISSCHNIPRALPIDPLFYIAIRQITTGFPVTPAHDFAHDLMT